MTVRRLTGQDDHAVITSRGDPRLPHRDTGAGLASGGGRGAISPMIHDVSFPAALIAGLVSFLSPCVLPLVPPYLIYLTGATIEHVASGEPDSASKRVVLVSALTFVLGFSTVFVALGASASLVGGLIRAWSAQL